MGLREFTADDVAAVRLATGIENVRNAVDAPWELLLTEHRVPHGGDPVHEWFVIVKGPDCRPHT